VVSKPVAGGAYAYQRLNFATMWEGSLTTCQGFKPYLGNPAVWHYRGGLGKRRHGGIVHPPCNRKSEEGNPPPTAGAPHFYPSRKCRAVVVKHVLRGRG
jgi:hypothetical protein